MTIKQLSVFLENERGSLTNVLEVLGKNKVNLIALSLADTAEYGMLRMIVSDPEKGMKLLRGQGISAHLVDVMAIKVSHKCGSLYEITNLIMQCADIEYMYAFANGDDAPVIVKVSDFEKAKEILEEKGIQIWSEEEAYNLNAE